MERVKSAKLGNRNDVLGMLLELAVVDALKTIPVFLERTSQFNEFYQQDRCKGPDVIFKFNNYWEKNSQKERYKLGVIECKNLNKDFVIGRDWFKKSIESRFYPTYAKLDAYILVLSVFKTSPEELAYEIMDKYRIVTVDFQITDDETYYKAVPILAKKLNFLIESLNKQFADTK